MFNPYYQAPNYAAQYPQQQPMQPQYNNRGIVKGRPVGSVDEVRAAQADFDGSISYFPCMAEGAIYTKCVDLNGMPVIQRFVLERPGQQDKVVTVSMLENRLSEFMKGVQNGQSNAAYANASNEQQPPVVDATTIR